MKIAEMHVWFRQYAQQMGMQNVRAILPEQIDILINTSISDIVNQLIRDNIGVVNDRVITDNAKLNQINALKTLYKVAIIDMVPPVPTISKETRTFNFSASDKLTGKMTTDFIGSGGKNGSTNIPNNLFLVDFALNYKVTKDGYTGINNNVEQTTYSIKTAKAAIDNINSFIKENIPVNETTSLDVYNYRDQSYDILNVSFDETDYLVDTNSGLPIAVVNRDAEGNEVKPYFILLDEKDNPIIDGVDFTQNEGTLANPIVVSQTPVTVSYIQPTFDEDAITTNFFPVRIIQDSFLADTLNDFVLKNRLRTPIIVTYNNGTFDLYIDEFEKYGSRYALKNHLIPYQLRMSYIAKPAVVKYDEDLAGLSVDCDLPESLHVDILKHAVDLYTTSIQGSLYSAQQQQQMQNRETSRNEARPDNEGYQN